MSKSEIYKYIKDGDDFYCHNVDAEIDRNRKGNFELVIMDSSGELVDCESVDVKMIDIDYNFGANIFMLGEYDNADKNGCMRTSFAKHSILQQFHYIGKEQN